MNEGQALGSAAEFYDRYWAFRMERGDHVATNRVKLRHEQAADFLVKRLGESTHASVLDMGCGDGLLGQVLGPRGFAVTGVDISPRALEVAGPHYGGTRVFDLDADATPDEWRGHFDAVVCLEVLEHIEKPRMNLRRAFELCRPGGVAVFSYPNMFSWKNRLAFVRGRWPGGYTTFDPREHLQVFELPIFLNWVREAGFEPVGTAITPDLPGWRPMRRAMFRARDVLNRFWPALWAAQINIMAEKR